MRSFPVPLPNTRLGFHYFPDSLHYREKDLQTWLPELTALTASWLTLIAPAGRAIPELFLRTLLDAQIEPVLHFDLPLDTAAPLSSLRLLFSTYARWGVHYVTLFDRPNLRHSWPAAAWAQADLVERFLDLYLPLAEAAVAEGLIPVFPPLEPGGDYWDLAFLRSALHGLHRRGSANLLDSLVLSACAWTYGRPLNWGSGGPERWPGARPYFTPPGTQDQIGFRIFDWYLSIARQELGHTLPILLLRAGSRPEDEALTVGPAGRNGHTPLAKSLVQALSDHARRNLTLARWISGDLSLPAPGGAAEAAHLQDPIPDEVLTCNFWLLAAAPDTPAAAQAWFHPDGGARPVVGELRQWNAKRKIPGRLSTSKAVPATADGRPITHYLLLPLYAWGAADWDLEAVRPFIQKAHPTVGFSIEEALLAERVTLVGSPQSLPEGTLEKLRGVGCVVDRLNEDGTLLALE